MEQDDFKCNNNCVILVLRLFETSGSPQDNVEVEFDNVFRINKAVETDLLERSIESAENGIQIKDRRRLFLTFGKFEIKTIKICISI